VTVLANPANSSEYTSRRDLPAPIKRQPNNPQLAIITPINLNRRWCCIAAEVVAVSVLVAAPGPGVTIVGLSVQFTPVGVAHDKVMIYTQLPGGYTYASTFSGFTTRYSNTGNKVSDPTFS
jgi:hypothetical protein